MRIFLEMHHAGRHQDSHAPSHLTQSHAPPPDVGGEDLAGELEADEVSGGDVEPAQETCHQPYDGEILAW